MAKAQAVLGKMFKTFSSGFSDEQLDKFIADSERIMRRPAGLLLAEAGLDASTSKPFALLDHACGTGPVASHLQQTVDKKVLTHSRMVCADVNENLVDFLKRRAEKYEWLNVETAILDAQKSGLPVASFSHVTIAFAMHIIPDPEAVLQEAMRLLQPGGVLGFTVWHKDNMGWVPDMRSSFETLPFEAPFPDPMPMVTNGKTEYIDPDLVSAPLQRHGFVDVKVKTAEHVMRIESAEDYLRTFGMMRDWMVGSYWGEEIKEKAGDVLDDHILRHLTEKHGGHGWDLTWSLILVTCRKPSN